MKLVPSFALLLFFGSVAFAQLPGWVGKSFRPINAASVKLFAGNDAAVVREYGFVYGEHREYGKDGKSLSVNLWKMRDPSGAYGLYTFYREPGTASVEAGGHIAVLPNRLVIQSGPYVMDAAGDGLNLGDGKLLLSKIAQSDKADSVGTILPAYLPEHGLVPQTLKFVMGPVAFSQLVKNIPAAQVGFETGAEAEIAEYTVDGRKVRLVLIDYATPQIAARKLRDFQQLPGAANPDPGAGIFFQRKGSILGLTLGPLSAVEAQNLLQDINHETEVTWNQRVPTKRDNIGDLILNVMLLAGFVLLFSLIAGLSYGGIRILAKKFMPGAVFDRPSQIEIIQLHLSDR